MDEHRDYLDPAQYDGVLALCSIASPWLPELLRNFKCPIVDMWLDYPELPFPRVLLDNVGLGRSGTEHLLAKGFRNLLFYGHSIEGKSIKARAEGFRIVAGGANLKHQALIWDHKLGPKGRQARTAWLAAWLANAELPLGVLGSKDQTACEVLDAAEMAGLQVPGQVAVIGVDNDPAVTELATVPLTSVDSARERVGYEAAALLDRLMDGGPPPVDPIRIPPGPVMARRSTDVLAVCDPEVAEAIQFIREHFAEPITADDVAAQAGVSSRHLLTRIFAETGRTIRDTILWQRLEFAQQLLVTSDTKIQVIAQKSGFGTGENMARVFRRVVGLSPEQYRGSYASTHLADARQAKGQVDE